ncbi:GIY-YIG nuclease family protein [Thermodesulfobacteriota bacterium]
MGINNRIIYIGSSSDLNQRLTQYYHTDDLCIRTATQFAVETSTNYNERERELLVDYRSRHGRLPQCNDRI